MSLKGWWLGVLTLGLFLWLNTWNRCQPGWCGRYGIPLTFYKWSDSIPEINGVTQLPKVETAPLAVDIAVAIATATLVVAVASRRPRAN